MVSNKKLYDPAKAEIIRLERIDIITTSIGEDEGEDDGEWVGFVFNRQQSIGQWSSGVWD